MPRILRWVLLCALVGCRSADCELGWVKVHHGQLLEETAGDYTDPRWAEVIDGYRRIAQRSWNPSDLLAARAAAEELEGLVRVAGKAHTGRCATSGGCAHRPADAGVEARAEGR